MSTKKLIWILPIAALVFTAWILLKFVADKGVLIELSFEDAAGIQAEQTQLRYRGVEIGVVKKVTISEDNKAVQVSVVLNKGAEHFAVKGSTFWIVRPRMNFNGVSGLETLVEGSYITVRPGDPDQEKEEKFVALSSAPILAEMENAVPFVLTSKAAGSLNIGDAVRYRGLKIGLISKVVLSRNSQRIDVVVNIHREYRKLIRVDSVFTRMVGIQAKLGLFGSELKVGALDNLLRGGVELYNPPKVGAMAKPGQAFWLDEKPPEKADEWEPVVNIY